MTKAEFTGTCQLCGRSQKLPKGHLSLHGYSVEWSMFLGTCHGSRHLPFEKSIGLIEKAIAGALEVAAALTASAEKLEMEENPELVWVNEYVEATWQHRKSSRVWRCLPRAEFTELGYFTSWKGLDGRMNRTNVYGGKESGQELSRQRATFLRREASDQHRYAEWQKARIVGWRETDLQPVS